MVALGASVPSAYAPWAVQKRIGEADGRLALDSVLMPRPNLSYIDYRSGVMASGDTGGVGGSSHEAMRVKPASGLAVTVEMGNCVINTPSEGAYMCVLDSVKTLPLSASSSTANRIDLIVARVYDDRNSALASDPGERKFVVEVWEGDPATGTPTVPTPTPAAGWHPLAAVTVSQNAASLTVDNIADHRGPGLVARGGMRALYLDDAHIGSAAFDEAGAYPGDQRWVHGNQFPHQVYWGANGDGTIAGWRGVHNELVYNVEPANPSPGTWYRGTGLRVEICRVTIPYPGTPFSIAASARFNPLISPGVSMEARIFEDDMITGTPVNFSGVNTFGADRDQPIAIAVPPITIGPFTAEKTLVLNAYIRYAPDSGSGFSYYWANPGQHLLQAVVKPATIDPSKVWGPGLH